MKRKGTLIKKTILSVMLILVAIFIFSMLEYIEEYRKELKLMYESKISFVQKMSNIEKTWIMDNQGEDGEIYLNYMGSGAGDVNPYFASLAAQGLLVGNVTEKNLDSVRRYLLWHKEHFIAEEGEISNYRIIDGKLQSTDMKDSVDSYIAVYLSLFCQYGERGGDIKSIDSDGSMFMFAIKKLESLMKYGLTAVSEEKKVYYLLDNIEVYAAFLDAKTLLEREGNQWLSEDLSQEYIKYIDKLIGNIKNSIEENLWNYEEKRYEVGLGRTGNVLEFKGWENLYPDAVAQIYGVAFIEDNKRLKRYKALYEKFCEEQRWELIELKEDDKFIWANICFIASKMNDLDRAEIYLEQYQKRVIRSRKYPIYTTEAAWVVKSCAILEEEYKQKSDQNIIQDMLEWIKERIE